GEGQGEKGEKAEEDHRHDRFSNRFFHHSLVFRTPTRSRWSIRCRTIKALAIPATRIARAAYASVREVITTGREKLSERVNRTNPRARRSPSQKPSGIAAVSSTASSPSRRVETSPRVKPSTRRLASSQARS